MALYQVYIEDDHGCKIGVLVTGSEMTAVAVVEGYVEAGAHAWYEQIQ